MFKRFCENCEHYMHDNTKCYEFKEIKSSNYISKTNANLIYHNPSIDNANGNCPYYKETRPSNVFSTIMIIIALWPIWALLLLIILVILGLFFE